MPVQPGQELGFIQVLRDAGLFPLPVGRHSQHPGPVATPFLVVPAVPSDQGTSRALPAAPAHLHFTGIHVLDNQNREIAVPVAGEAYTLVADIQNNGSGGAYGGVAEFYVRSPTIFDEAASSGAPIAAHGYSSFVALPRAGVSVRCPTPWLPTSDDLTSSILVQVYDLSLDPLDQPFNARSDRHVGRLDLTDFSGVWEGLLVGINQRQVQFTITQDGLNVSVTPPGLSTPLVGTVDRDQVKVANFISDQEQELWTLTLAQPDTLHVRDEDLLPGFNLELGEGDLHRTGP